MAGWTPGAPRPDSPGNWRDVVFAVGCLGSALGALVALEGKPLALMLALELLIISLLVVDARGLRSRLRLWAPGLQVIFWLGLATPGALALAVAVVQVTPQSSPAKEATVGTVAQAAPVVVAWPTTAPAQASGGSSPAPAVATPTATAVRTPPALQAPPTRPSAVAAAAPAAARTGATTAAPAAVPTAAPTSIPTAQPTASTDFASFVFPPAADATATPTGVPVAEPGFWLDVLSLTSPLKPGSLATIALRTVPGAQTTIVVYYKPGDRLERSLTPQVADSTGLVSWTWRIGTGPGPWRVDVTASKDGLSAQAQTELVVDKPNDLEPIRKP